MNRKKASTRQPATLAADTAEGYHSSMKNVQPWRGSAISQQPAKTAYAPLPKKTQQNQEARGRKILLLGTARDGMCTCTGRGPTEKLLKADKSNKFLLKSV